MGKFKDPPAFSQSYSYTKWKNEVQAWKEVVVANKCITEETVGQVLALSLPSSAEEGDIRGKVMDAISADELKGAAGYTNLIKWMDDHMGRDDTTNTIDKIRDFMKYRKREDQRINDYIAGFDAKYHAAVNSGLDKLPQAYLMWLVIENAEVSEQDTKLIMSGVDLTKKATLYTQAKESITKYLAGPGSRIEGNSGIKLKSETLFTKSGGWNKPKQYVPNYPLPLDRGRGGGAQRPGVGAGGAKPKTEVSIPMNPMKNGRRLLCDICGTFTHFKRDCPFNPRPARYGDIPDGDQVNNEPYFEDGDFAYVAHTYAQAEVPEEELQVYQDTHINSINVEQKVDHVAALLAELTHNSNNKQLKTFIVEVRDEGQSSSDDQRDSSDSSGPESDTEGEPSQRVESSASTENQQLGPRQSLDDGQDGSGQDRGIERFGFRPDQIAASEEAGKKEKEEEVETEKEDSEDEMGKGKEESVKRRVRRNLTKVKWPQKGNWILYKEKDKDVWFRGQVKGKGMKSSSKVPYYNITPEFDNNMGVNLDNYDWTYDSPESNKDKIIFSGPDNGKKKKTPTSGGRKGKKDQNSSQSPKLISRKENEKNVDTYLTYYTYTDQITRAEKAEKLDNTFVVFIPRDQWDKPFVKEEKEKELANFQSYGAYQEVRDEGQPRMSSGWIVTEKLYGEVLEKLYEEVLGAKARLVVHGNQERKYEEMKDQRMIKTIHWIDTTQQLGDVFTKRGASTEAIIKTIEKGKFFNK